MSDPYQEGHLERALAALVEALDQASIPYMVVGGMAVLVHGEPRLTRDVDVTISLSPEDVPRLVQALGTSFQSLVADPQGFVEETMVLPVEAPDGTRVDLILAGLPFEQDAISRARLERFGGVEARVCTPEDLIIYKIVSERPKDRADVVGILARSGQRMDLERLDRIIGDLGRDLESPEIVETWRRLRGESA